MRFKSLLLLAAMLALVSPVFSNFQSPEEFRDPDGKFTLSLPQGWRAVSYNDAVGRPKMEFIYFDRREGLLKISKETLSGGTLQNMARTEEENLRTYRPGFERASTEAFGGGTLKGLRFSFYTTESGRQVANTYYYLEDEGSVWVLRFGGRRGVLDINRNITDQMARSFKPMK